eukprot:tig00021537_g22321.t1
MAGDSGPATGAGAPLAAPASDAPPPRHVMQPTGAFGPPRPIPPLAPRPVSPFAPGLGAGALTVAIAAAATEAPAAAATAAGPAGAAGGEPEAAVDSPSKARVRVPPQAVVLIPLALSPETDPERPPAPPPHSCEDPEAGGSLRGGAGAAAGAGSRGALRRSRSLVLQLELDAPAPGAGAGADREQLHAHAPPLATRRPALPSLSVSGRLGAAAARDDSEVYEFIDGVLGEARGEGAASLLEDGRTRPLSLAFAGPALEAAYRRHHAAQARPLTPPPPAPSPSPLPAQSVSRCRVCALLLLLASAYQALCVSLGERASPGPAQLAFVPYLAVAAASGAALLLLGSRRTVSNPRLAGPVAFLLCAALAAAAAGSRLLSRRLDAAAVAPASAVAAAVVARLLWRPALAAALLALGATLPGALLSLDPLPSLALSLPLLATAAVLAPVGRALEATSRRSFLLARLAQETAAAAGAEKAHSDRIVENILPGRATAGRAPRRPRRPLTAAQSVITACREGRLHEINRRYDAVAVVFVSLAQPPAATAQNIASIMPRVNAYLAAVEELAERHGLLKIKTVGFALLAACGLPDERPAAECAAAAAAFAAEAVASGGRLGLPLKVGAHVGPLVAGVIGARLAYDIFGDSVNVAQRMCMYAPPGAALVSGTLAGALPEGAAGGWRLSEARVLEVKGKGPMATHELLPALLPTARSGRATAAPSAAPTARATASPRPRSLTFAPDRESGTAAGEATARSVAAGRAPRSEGTAAAGPHGAALEAAAAALADLAASPPRRATARRSNSFRHRPAPNPEAGAAGPAPAAPGSPSAEHEPEGDVEGEGEGERRRPPLRRQRSFPKSASFRRRASALELLAAAPGQGPAPAELATAGAVPATLASAAAAAPGEPSVVESLGPAPPSPGRHPEARPEPRGGGGAAGGGLLSAGGGLLGRLSDSVVRFLAYGTDADSGGEADVDAAAAAAARRPAAPAIATPPPRAAARAPAPGGHRAAPSRRASACVSGPVGCWDPGARKPGGPRWRNGTAAATSSACHPGGKRRAALEPAFARRSGTGAGAAAAGRCDRRAGGGAASRPLRGARAGRTALRRVGRRPSCPGPRSARLRPAPSAARAPAAGPGRPYSLSLPVVVPPSPRPEEAAGGGGGGGATTRRSSGGGSHVDFFDMGRPSPRLSASFGALSDRSSRPPSHRLLLKEGSQSGAGDGVGAGAAGAGEGAPLWLHLLWRLGAPRVDAATARQLLRCRFPDPSEEAEYWRRSRAWGLPGLRGALAVALLLALALPFLDRLLGVPGAPPYPDLRYCPQAAATALLFLASLAAPAALARLARPALLLFALALAAQACLLRAAFEFRETYADPGGAWFGLADVAFDLVLLHTLPGPWLPARDTLLAAAALLAAPLLAWGLEGAGAGAGAGAAFWDLLLLAAVCGLAAWLREIESRGEFLLDRRLLAETRALAAGYRQSERLLALCLPPPIAAGLKSSAPDWAGPAALAGGPGSRSPSRAPLARYYPRVAVLCADVVGFTPLSASLDPAELVAMLDELYSELDELAEQRAVAHLKTVGDAWLAVAGLEAEVDAPALHRIVDLGLAVVAAFDAYAARTGRAVAVRVGVAAGAATGAVLGKRRWQFDMFGEAMEAAGRLEAASLPGRVHLSGDVAAAVASLVPLEAREGPRGAASAPRDPSFLVALSGAPPAPLAPVESPAPLPAPVLPSDAAAAGAGAGVSSLGSISLGVPQLGVQGPPPDPPASNSPPRVRRRSSLRPAPDEA